METYVNKKQLLMWFIVIAVPALICLIPVTAVYTPSIKLFLCITLCAIFILAFELMDNIIIAIFLPMLYVLTGIAPAQVAYGGWLSFIPWMLVGAFLLSNVLNSSGLLERIAYWCILKTGGSYNGILYGTMLGGIIISLLTGVNGTLVVATICFGICNAFKLGKSKESAVIMMVAGVGTVLPQVFIYNPLYMGLMLTGANNVVPLDIGWIELFLQNIPNLFFCFLFVFVVTKVFKPDIKIEGASFFQEKYDALGKFNVTETKVGLIAGAFMIFLFTGGIHHVPLMIGFAIIPWAFYLPGINAAGENDIAKINFPIILFAVACLAIGNVSGYLQLGTVVSKLVLPYLSEAGTVGTLFLVWVIGIVLNFLLTPMAIMSAFPETFTQIALDLNINPLAILYTLYGSMDQIILPYEFIQYLIIFSFGVVPIKYFIKIMGLKMILATVFLLVVIIPYWYLIGLL